MNLKHKFFPHCVFWHNFFLKKKMLSRAIIPRRTFAVIRMRGASKVDKEGMPESKNPFF
jgi:hypothetical protein